MILFPRRVCRRIGGAMEQWSCFDCDEIKSGALTIAMVDQINEAVKDIQIAGYL